MFIKIKKLKFINLVLAACILSTTVAPSAQAMGLFGYLKKMVSPSAQTENTENLGIIAPSDNIVDISTAPEIATEESSTFGKIFSSKNAIRLFITMSILIISINLTKYLNLKKTTIEKSKEMLKLEDVSQEQTEEVRQIAKELGISDDKIKRIQVVKEKDQSPIEHFFGAAAFNSFDLVITPKETPNKTFNKIQYDQNIRKFFYAHELSHIKYNHLNKREYLEKILMPISTISAILIDKILCEIFNHLKPECLNKIKLGLLKKPTLLIKFALKFVYLPILAGFIRISAKKHISLPIERIQEKNADLSAASITTYATIGGILFFEFCQKMMDNYSKNNNNQIQKKLDESTDNHPSNKTRITYLKKLLTTEDQKEQLTIERKKFEKIMSLDENFKKIIDNFEIQQFVDETIKNIEEKIKSTEIKN